MNDPQYENGIILDAINDPVFFMDEMAEAGAEKNIFRNQRESFRHGCQGKDLFLKFQDECIGIARAVSGNI